MKPEETSPVPPFVSLSAVLTDECCFLFLFLFFVYSCFCQFDGFPFHEVSADVG